MMLRVHRGNIQTSQSVSQVGDSTQEPAMWYCLDSVVPRKISTTPVELRVFQNHNCWCLKSHGLLGIELGLGTYPKFCLLGLSLVFLNFILPWNSSSHTCKILVGQDTCHNLVHLSIWVSPLRLAHESLWTPNLWTPSHGQSHENMVLHTIEALWFLFCTEGVGG